MTDLIAAGLSPALPVILAGLLAAVVPSHTFRKVLMLAAPLAAAGDAARLLLVGLVEPDD